MKARWPQRSSENGLVALAMIVLLLLIGAYFMLGSLNFAAVRVDRDHATNESLLRAKEALIAYAASDSNRPGELPCPDVNNDGSSLPIDDYAGSNCVSLIGRLPWKTLGLPDLRDDAGERLWFALSNDFHANGSVPLNSDTAFRGGNSSLAITGQQSVGNLIAIVFAPGAPLVRQDAAVMQNRSAAGVLTASNYLDFANSESNSDTNRIFVSGAKSATFNDRLMPIHSDDIMWLVERRAGRELAQKLRDHYVAWESATGEGFYPWAAPFADPANPQSGQNNVLEGLLPVSAASTVWTSASVTSGLCTGVGTSELVCTALVILNLGGQVTARLGNIATSFTNPPDGSEVTTSGLVLLGTPVTNWSVNKSQQALDFTADVTFLGTGVATVRVRAPSPSPWLTSSWLMTNRWYQNAYYAVAAPYAIDGNHLCGACITVANTAASGGSEAVVVMTGRALPLAVPAQNTRPVAAPASVDQFLEGTNGTTADRIFEQSLKTATFNDLPVVVRP